MSIIYGNVKPTFMEIYPDWKYITKTSPKKTVLKAGTPLNAQGRVTNTSYALGLVAEDTGESDNPISIIVGGVVDYAKVTAGYGPLSNDVITALTGIRIIKRDGSAIVPSSLPSVSSADNGKVLTVSGGKWSAQSPSSNRFSVTLTPTEEDFSGVMSETVEDIYDAFLRGKDIWFQISAMGWALNIRVGEVNFKDGYDYPSFNADTLIGPEVTGSGYALLHAGTGATNDGTYAAYATNIFPLTSGSGGSSGDSNVGGGDSPD